MTVERLGATVPRGALEDEDLHYYVLKDLGSAFTLEMVLIMYRRVMLGVSESKRGESKCKQTDSSPLHDSTGDAGPAHANRCRYHHCTRGGCRPLDHGFARRVLC